MLNTTIRQQQAGNLYYADSNAPISPAGTIGLNWSTVSATHWLANYFSIPPTVSTPGSTATTTYAYDNNGNLISAATAATTTTYTYDYLNRLTGSRTTGASATTTYGYDVAGNRVSQATGNVTTLYPSKYYSIVTDTSAASTTATSTEYIFNGDALLATIDRPMIDGVATGTAVVRYVHTDNLGSTNVTSDERGDLAQWFDYAPYGAVVESTNTGTTTAARQYIGQFTDGTGLSYLNARYYQSDRGQFLSEDPVFWSQQNLKDPQSLNAYSYSENNPITKSDPKGKYVELSAEGNFLWLSGSAGFRFDSTGLDFFIAGGGGYGVGGGVTLGWYPGQEVSHTLDSTASVGVSGSFIVGASASYGGKYIPDTVSVQNPKPNLGFTIGPDVGGGAYVRKEWSFPLLGGQSSKNNNLSSNAMNFVTPTYISTPSYNNSRTNSQGNGQSQRSAISGFTAAFSSPSLTSAQKQAVQGVIAAFSNK